MERWLRSNSHLTFAYLITCISCSDFRELRSIPVLDSLGIAGHSNSVVLLPSFDRGLAIIDHPRKPLAMLSSSSLDPIDRIHELRLITAGWSVAQQRLREIVWPDEDHVHAPCSADLLHIVDALAGLDLERNDNSLIGGLHVLRGGEAMGDARESRALATYALRWKLAASYNGACFIGGIDLRDEDAVCACIKGAFEDVV